jgi:hypothetical protein
MKLHTENRDYSLIRTGVMRRAALRGPAPVSPVRNKNYVPQKAAGSFVPQITKLAFEKFGFPAAALITDWSKIVGADVAAYTMPERLKWARKIGDSSDGDESGSGRPAATLVLRVDPARALDIDYKTRMLLDRINAFFGYRAVGTLKIVQGMVDAVSSVTGAAPERPASVPMVAPGTDPLTAALDRLGAQVTRRSL